MPTPILIDTDMGIDDAVAIALVAGIDALDLVGIASVEGNVPLDQATANVARLLGGLDVPRWPLIARGLAQSDGGLHGASHVFGRDGLGELDLPLPPCFAPGEFLDLYTRLIETHRSSLAILAIGPMTNLAAVLRDRPGLLEQAGTIVVMGGAVWCRGNVTPEAEFNLYRDPAAAAAVLSAGLPLTLVPLDVTNQVALDESHLARLSRSGTRTGELLARMVRFPLERGRDAGRGTFLIHDAVALGVLLWPSLYMRSRMALDVMTVGPHAGRCRPRVGQDKTRQPHVVISVQAVDFLENLIEQLCHERFVV